MQFNVALLTISAVFAPFLQAQSSAQNVIEVTGSGQNAAYVPITVAYSDQDNDAPLVVVDEKSALKIPATYRDGQLTFIIEKISAEEVKRFRVEHGSLDHPLALHIEKQGDTEQLEVTIGDKLFTSYFYSNDEKKPYLWPINTVGGHSVTRDWPMGEADRSKDHPHHKSLWTAYGDLNKVDCWAEGGNSGYQRSGEVTWGSGSAYGWIRARNVWTNHDDKPVITEEREYRFYATPEDARLMDVDVTFRADYGDVKFGDTKEGGLVGVRMADALCEKGGNGTITNAAGGVGARQTWGKPAAWCDYSGTLEGAGACGLAVFDHPSNLRHPTHWHVRDYGLMGANCFGYSYFINKQENGDFEIKDGESLSFRYRVYVHAGDVKDASVAERYADFANPPTVRWAG